MINFKDIHIGSLIKKRMLESEINMERACNFLNYGEEYIMDMFKQKDLDTRVLLKWSKLLKYDFFRLYSQHLILYSPPRAIDQQKKQSLPQFRKNLYTKEIIDFVLELIEAETKSIDQVIEEYKIPKTTLYNWMKKYNNYVDEKENPT
ncbi:transposase [Chryseobacterium shigense]|uniref:Transcriptional regulator with PAS, ATPase and Fis domain n=1 Tax=Chryseobacterium shigense TaxID=297244 RepID=A0A841N6W0_9FLAO|nr:transposase [Chryseobacterium shigense]MBB6372614.1 transcriptional regulator with PAS, ATPase and Fis domain [Chryseobacterium shigense]